MRKNYKKLALVVCMVVCVGGVCVGCTSNTENKQNKQNAKPQSTSEVIEKEIEINSDSDEKIEYSLEGSAGDEDTQKESQE